MQREVTEYRIEVEETAGRMQIRMRDLIEAGWQPLGAPFYTLQNNIAQAVVRYAPTPTCTARDVNGDSVYVLEVE